MAKELHESGENYLETILEIEKELGEVRSVEIARRLGVSRASVSKAVSVLRETGYVEPAFYGEVVLTESGRAKAQEIMHRHQVLTRYLTEQLGLCEKMASADACRMEHVVSRAMMASIEATLAQPKQLPIRLVASNVEGALFDSGDNLPQHLPEMLDKLEEMRIRFVAVSAQSHQDLYQKFGALADKIFYIAQNGAVLAQGKQVIYTAENLAHEMHKGAGLQLICEHLGLQTGNCLVFGGASNDAEMLQTAGFAYVMENADPAMKLICNHTAPSNDENGVLRTIANFFGMGSDY